MGGAQVHLQRQCANVRYTMGGAQVHLQRQCANVRYTLRANWAKSISNSDTTPLFFKMAQNLDLRCVLVPLGAGAKTRLESRIKKFTPHCVCRPTGADATRSCLDQQAPCTRTLHSNARTHVPSISSARSQNLSASSICPDPTRSSA